MPYPIRRERPAVLTPSREEAELLVAACDLFIKDPRQPHRLLMQAAHQRDVLLRYIRNLDAIARAAARKAAQENGL